MAYTFLDNSLNTIGVLTNKGGQTNDYWGDSITHEIATSQDVLTSVSLSVDKPSVNIDTSGNQKTWNHVIQGLSFNIDGIGRQVNENDYLIYQEGTNGKYYLMAITQVDESAVQSGFHYKTVQGLNAAAYDLSRKTLRAKSFAQIPDNTQEKGTAQNILKYIFEDINWDVRTIGSFGAVDYDIAEGTTAQAVLLDIIGMFEAEVDAYVQLNNWGKGANVFNKNGSIKRIFDFSTSLGKYRGETIRYDKNMVSITKTGARDSMYTKLYVNGNNITIADANKGADFIVDDVANRKYNKLGAVSTPVTYLEGIISNSAIESPTALLAWGKRQLKILNHPRYNYQISATNDDKVQLGDTVIIQDTHASDPIYLKSKVISKTVSLADPANNSFIVGEFSPIVIGADNGLEDTNQIMQLVNQANQTAINAQNKANENAKKIVDTRTNLEKTIDQKLQEGKDYSDSLDQKQKEAYDKFEAEINAGMDSAAAERAEISKKADDMLVSANSHADDMYNNAVAVAKDEASKALSDANTSLDEAKTDLTDGLNKEIADRNKAVSVVNSQAQDYADQAKSDALNAITKEVSDREKAVSALDTKATNAVNQAKSDINDTINALTVGGRNLLLDTGRSFTGIGDNSVNGNFDTKGGRYYLAGVKKVSDLYNQYGSNGYLTLSFKWVASGSTISGSFNPVWDNTPWGVISPNVTIQPSVTNKSGRYEVTIPLSTNNYSTGVATSLRFRQDNLQGNITISNIKLEAGNKATDWTPAPEDVVLDYTTKDNQIKATITQYKDTNDGKVSKAQTDATTALGLVATKVSQTDYDQKTGDLSTKYTAVKQTVDSQATDIVNIKATATSQASKINSISSDVNGTKQSISDIETTQDSQSNKINQITSDVNGTKQSITDIQTKDGKQDTRMGNIETSVSGIKSDFSTYKTTNDGAVKTAQTTAQTAVDGLKTKVSQTDYNTKTGQLQTDLTATTQTANQAKTDIVAIKSEANSQSAQINDIVSDAKGTKQTVSDLKTEQGKQSGSIATLQSRADGFDATVTKVNNLSVGGTNLIRSSEFDRYWSKPSQATTVDGYNGHKAIHVDITGWTGRSYVDVQQPIYNADVQFIKSGEWYTISFYAKGKGTIRTHIYPSVIDTSAGSYADGVFSSGYVPGDGRHDWALTDEYVRHSWSFKARTTLSPTTNTGNMLFRTMAGNSTYVSLPKLEKGNIATDWSPAPEDLSSATAKAQLTADNATLSINNYKTDADGRISKAQSDITATSKEVSTKVSQSDYDKKTQELSTQYGQVKTTADAVTTDVSKYKTANDKKVSANSASINTLNNQITSKVSQTDFDKTTGDLNGKFTQQKQTVDSISQTVTELQAKANAQGQVNQLMNTEFSPDLEGWDSSETSSGVKTPYRQYIYQGSNMLTFDARNQTDKKYSSIKQTIPFSTSGSNRVVSLSWWSRIAQGTDLYGSTHIRSYDASMTKLTDVAKNWDSSSSMTLQKFENVAIPNEAQFVEVTFAVREGYLAFLTKPMLVYQSTIGDYVQGNYNNNSRVSALELDVKGIHGTVNDPKKGLSATWDLASNGQTLAVQAQKDAKTADGKAVAAQKDATTAVTTAKGTQTTVASVQKDVKDVQSKQTQTANQVTTEIKDRQKGDTNTLTQAKNFTSSSITSSERGLRTEIQQSASGVVAQVGQINRLFNTQFTPDLQGWSATADHGNPPYRSYTEAKYGATYVGYNNTTITDKTYARLQQTVDLPSTITAGTKLSISWVARTNAKQHYTNLWILFYDNNNKSLTDSNKVMDWGSKALHSTEELKLENVDVPTNAKKVTISFEAREGTNAYLANPMLTFTPKAYPYMPGGYHSTSTVLELFDGRFALGIKNNTGNIISGINGDSSGLSIVGKKITISGDTTFLGTNFMSGALIKNASIASAKIQNLDVDKLTGKTTEFVKSSWNSAYGYVNIEYGQMSVMGNNGITYFGDGYIHISAMNIAKNPPVLEDIGSFGSNKNIAHTNVDYLAINLNLWNTGKGYGEFGGDGIAFNVSQSNGTYQSMLSWESTLSSGYLGWLKGWHFRDYASFDNNLFGPGKEQIGIGNINAVPALSIGDPLTGIAGNNGNLYFYTKNGYISLDDVINNKTRKATFKRTGFWK